MGRRCWFAIETDSRLLNGLKWFCAKEFAAKLTPSRATCRAKTIQLPEGHTLPGESDHTNHKLETMRLARGENDGFLFWPGTLFFPQPVGWNATGAMNCQNFQTNCRKLLHWTEQNFLPKQNWAQKLGTRTRSTAWRLLDDYCSTPLNHYLFIFTLPDFIYSLISLY